MDLRDATLVGTVFDNTTCPNGDISVNGSCLDNTPGLDELAGVGTDCLTDPPVPRAAGRYFNCDLIRGVNDWFTGQDLRDADFAGALVDIPDLTGADLTGADFRVITATGIDFFTWSNTICPDGTNSDTNGMTCIGHLEGEVHFSVIGDYGDPDLHGPVARKLVTAIDPDFVVTTGDNTYLWPLDAAAFQASVGDIYREFMDRGDFYPAMGNHDATRGIFNFASAVQPYLNYFGLDKTYFDVQRGPVHLFVVDNERLLQDHRLLCTDRDDAEPYCPANTARHVTAANQFSRQQDDWLRTGLAASTAPWKIVVMHHAPYSSGAEHGSQALQQWDFATWGADVVLAGHDHIYERLFPGDGIPYFVVGTSGGDLRCGEAGARVSPFQTPLPLPGVSKALNGCDPADNPGADVQSLGAMDIHATRDQITFRYRNYDGSFVDICRINRDGTPSDKPCDGASPPPDGYTAFNDFAWGSAAPEVEGVHLQPNANLTLLTGASESGASRTGELLDRSTGYDTDVVLTVSGGEFYAGTAAAESGRAPTGSDADAVFGSFVDTLGAITGTGKPSPSGDIVLAFEGLDPDGAYELALYGDRDELGWEHAALVSIEGATRFENTSSTGADDLGAPVYSGPSDPSTRIPADNVDGRVVRFTNVGSGSDGRIDVRVASDGSSPDSVPFANAVMLRTVLAPDTVVLVAGSTTPPPGDVPIVQRLEALGHQVRIVDDDALTQASIAGADLVVVSSSVVPAKIPAWLSTVAAPLVNNEAYANSTFGLGAVGRDLAGQTKVRIVGSGPLAAGLTGRPVITSSSATFAYVLPAPSGDVIATIVNNTNRATVVAFETGAQLTTGPAPARRAGFFLGYDTAGRLNGAGLALFDAVINWAMG